MPVISPDTSVQNITNKAADLTVKKAGDLALATVHLFTNNINPGPNNVVGDFTEAVFTGYVAKAIPGWTANELPGDGNVGTTGTTVLTWVGPADATGQTIYGYFVLSVGAGTPLIYACRFPAQVPLAVPTDVLDLVPTYTEH
jgi:hypothetical protein